MTARARIHAIIGDHIKFRHSRSVEDNADLRRDLQVDDLDLMCIAIAIEMEFGIDIGDAEFSAIETVGDVEALVVAKLRMKADV